MEKAKQGDTVQVHYTGTLEDGTVFDSSQGGEPLEFTIGTSQVIAGFEEAIVGMSIGDRKREVIAAGRAYGEHEDDLIFTVGRDQLPEGSDVSVGDMLRVGFPDGQTAAVQVAEMDAKSLTLDANHPLAGKTLIFDLQLVGIT